MSAVLTARSTSFWRGTHEIAVDGRPVTTWTPAAWSGAGEFSLDGRHHTLSGGSWGSRYALVADGTPVARADHVGRRDWTLDADGRTRTFRRRRSVWSGDQVLVEGDRVLGGVRHAGRWRGDAEAELPGMDLPVQVLAVAVVLTLWSHQASAAVT